MQKKHKVSSPDKKDKGQSTIEYVILTTVVLVVLIIFLQPNDGIFSRTFNDVLKTAANEMNDVGDRILGAHTSQ